MDKKNGIIILLIVALVAAMGFFFYQTKKQQEIQQQLLSSLKYNAANGDGKGKLKDPYKEIAVNNALRKKAKDIQECYKVFIKSNPEKTNGFVEIDWNILEDGKVKRAELVSSDLNTDSLNKCILKIISEIEFPAPPAGIPTYITHKYNFKKTEEIAK